MMIFKKTILQIGIGGRNATSCIKSYIKYNIHCRRKLLLQNFLLYSENNIVVNGCNCCDVCAIKCSCILCVK